MSDFWQGVLALPLILLGVATAVGVVLGGWLALEKWAERRTSEYNREPNDDLNSQIIYRRELATWVLAVPKLRQFKLGYGCCLLYVRGLNRISKDDLATVRGALYKVTDQMNEEATK